MLKKTLLFISLITTGATNYLVSNSNDSILEIHTDSDNTIKIGQEFIVSVYSGGAVGLDWNIEFDSDYLEFIDRTTIEHAKEKNGEPIEGAGNTTEYRFKTLKLGTTTLTLTGDTPFAKAYSSNMYKIIIEPADIPELTPEQIELAEIPTPAAAPITELTPEQIELMDSDTKRLYEEQQKINAMTDQEISVLNEQFLSTTANQKPIKTSVGQQFIINAKVNYSAGGCLEIKFLDEQFLKHIGTTSSSYPVRRRLPQDYLLIRPTEITYAAVYGGGCSQQYHFQALKKGTTHIMIKYGLSWRPCTRTYIVEIE